MLDPEYSLPRPSVTQGLRIKKHMLGCLPRKQRWPDLTIEQILAWADAHHARTGEWPNTSSGLIVDAPREKWVRISECLRLGFRGLPPGSSLCRLLAQHRGVRNEKDLPRLTPEQILAWADAHHQRTGQWPTRDSGPIADAPGETWTAAHLALSHGNRGLPGGSSLARLLAEQRGVRNRMDLASLTEAQILAWADAHRERTGLWPNPRSGSIAAAPEEKWSAVDRALRTGHRDLPGGSSLARLLAAHRGVQHHLNRPRLSVKQILEWADAHYQTTGRWPTSQSGAIAAAPGERWSAVNTCLIQGNRGLRGGSSVARLLEEHRGVPNPKNRPELTVRQILAWADAHYARHGSWPRTTSGPVADAPDETWLGIEAALQHGNRGLPGGSTLHRLLKKHRRK